MAEEVVLMKGNEAIAHAAIRIGVDGYFGYPITPIINYFYNTWFFAPITFYIQNFIYKP